MAFCCAEFGVHGSLPIYSGGLGVLAGDHLKATSDLGVPLVAIGLLYAEGYFRQRLFVYERKGEPCRICGTPIRHAVMGQRSTYWCPKCQRP